MQLDDLSRLHHMLDAASEALSFATGHTRSDLDTDRKLLLALVKDVEIVGEAASRMSLELRNRHPQVPWVDIISMRHRLVHGYFNVDPDIVWSTVAEDLPPLVVLLTQVLEAEAPRGTPDEKGAGSE